MHSRLERRSRSCSRLRSLRPLCRLRALHVSTLLRRCAMNSTRLSAAILSLVVLTSVAPSATGQPIRVNDFRAWIERNHPNVITGDARVNSVFIVVDTNSQYVVSLADSLPLEITA